MFTGIDHVALHVTNIHQSIEFYQSHFNFKHYFEHTTESGVRIVYLKLGSTVLELLNNGSGHMDNLHFALHTTDFTAAVEKLQQANITMLQAPHSTPPRTPDEINWKRATFSGPNQEVIEIRGEVLQ